MESTLRERVEAFPVCEERALQTAAGPASAAAPASIAPAAARKPVAWFIARELLKNKFWILVAAAGILLCTLGTPFVGGDVADGSSLPQKILIGPVPLRGGVVQLERHAGSNVARLRIVTSTIWTDYRDCDAMFTVFKQALARKQPFMAIWDARSLTFPRVKSEQVNQVRKFVDGHAEAFDTHVQAHIILISNPIVRAFARVILHFFAPPQPYLITKTDEAADEFAREIAARRPRSFRKRSYDLSHEFSFPGHK